MSDADADDNTFESTDAGASEVCHPCKVAEVSTSKTGKHGGAPDCYPQVRKKSREERQMRDLPKAFRPGFLVHNGQWSHRIKDGSSVRRLQIAQRILSIAVLVPSVGPHHTPLTAHLGEGPWVIRDT